MFDLLKGCGRGVGTVLGIVAFSVAAAGCQPLKPSGGKKGGSGSSSQLTGPTADIGFSLSFAADTHASSETPVSLRVRVYQVVGEQVGAQEGDDLIFPITAGDALYHLQSVKLGLKEFVFEVLDARGEVIGDGHARYLVKPGSQQFDAIDITTRDPTRARRDVGLNVFVSVSTPGEVAKTTYMDVKEIFKESCATCHSDPGGTLVLSSFPFVSRTFDNQNDIVRDVVKAMRASTWQMPPDPNPRVADDKIALIAKWADDGLLQVPAATDDLTDLAATVIYRWHMVDSQESGEMTIVRGTDAAHPFAATWLGAVVDAKYQIEVEIRSRDGTLFSKQQIAAPQLVGAAGDVSLAIDVPYSAVTVDIPIVIH